MRLVRPRVGPRALGLLALAALVLALVTPAGARKKMDLFWKRPDIATFGVKSVALFPPATFNNDFDAEKAIALAWGREFRSTPYRWLGSQSVRDLLAGAGGSDSLVKAVQKELLETPRLDSLSAPGLCQRLRVDAILTLRADTYDQIKMEFDQAGKPTTTVAIKAALVDSSGALLWTASGQYTGEGPYHNPEEGALGVRSSGLGTQPMTGQGGPPSYAEVMSVLFARWLPSFPAPPK